MAKKLIPACISILICFAASTLAQDQQTIMSIIVINDKNQGIISELVKIDNESKETFIATTNRAGQYELNYQCGLGERIKAKPSSAVYYHSRKIDCYNKHVITVKVTHKTIVNNLLHNAQWAESQGSNGDAAWMYSEAAVRLNQINKQQSNEAAEKAYTNAAKAIQFQGNSITFDESQGKNVPSAEFVDALKQFQESNNLDKNGKLDTSTFHAISAGRLGQYMFRNVSNEK